MIKKDRTSSQHIRNLRNEQKNQNSLLIKIDFKRKRDSPSDLWIPRVKIPHTNKANFTV
ncbi:hypothetical protein LEP1GSC158_0668 [Leptospira interrogans serovar Zanoni str. LT2156]|uniref:Uncharacterized protein n=1 Tax=Leptospira interrogans serovar Zanoni str. LT2156 TaxID=1001601 RepID=M6HKV6_LEPIR|nr:hypothetical protein LEP1GSC158_0668 [Leptospira interrogans serovar Zanoni str. LT2156]